MIGKRVRISSDTRKLIHYISVLYESSDMFLREVEGYYGPDYIKENGPVQAVADYLRTGVLPPELDLGSVYKPGATF